jgi:hypothetical protein
MDDDPISEEILSSTSAERSQIVSDFSLPLPAQCGQQGVAHPGE